jgi:phosphoserine phosphatase RsbU/P
MKVKKSISRQLIVNIAIPVLLGLIIIGGFNIQNTLHLIQNNQKTEHDFIFDEIKSFIELQFVALSIIEAPMAEEMKKFSNQMVNDIFSNTQNIEVADLALLQKKLGMDPQKFDLYIINRDGIVANTTFKEDLFINFFNFGKAHRTYIENRFKSHEFDSPRFFFEHKTKRYKKYSYQTTLDGKYIIEIGLYSDQADKVYDYTINHLDQLPQKKKNITNVDMYMLGDKPYPFNLRREFIPDHLGLINELKQNKTIYKVEKGINNTVAYTYFFIPNNTPDIFDGIVIRISSNPQAEYLMTKKEIAKTVIILVITLILVYLLIYYRSKGIVEPIKKLIEKTKEIAAGNFQESVNIEGDSEVSKLSAYFNQMMASIQERNSQIEAQSEFLYQSNRKLNEAYKLLDHQKSLIENKQDDLKASIDYGLRIQQALIPDDNELAKLFKESFVFMLPRDIVSGDFYWYTRVKNKIVIVLSDCTGHGVPGAFMSMIGMTVMHHLVNEQNISDPAQLLTKLDTELNDLFINRHTKEHRFEGMDTIICCLDTDTEKLIFSSAQRPLIIVRNGTAFSYKGSIYPIGEYYDDIQKIFTNTTIDLIEGDSIYIFSDGFTSQFDADNNKKFNYDRFRKLLSDMNNRLMKEQPLVLQRMLDSWKGNAEQVDDILIVGFKYLKPLKSDFISAQNILRQENRL